MKKKQTRFLSRQEVSHVATLASLKLTANQIDHFQKQLSEILTFVSKIEKVNIPKSKRKKTKFSFGQITRDDTTLPSLSQNEVLANAPQKQNGFFKVKAIFDET